MQDTGFRDNIVSSQVGFGGGAIYLAAQDGQAASLTLRGGALAGNEAWHGAALTLLAADADLTATIEDVVIRDHQGGKGGIYIASDTGGQAELLVARSTFRSRPLFPTARIYVSAAFSGP